VALAGNTQNSHALGRATLSGFRTIALIGMTIANVTSRSMNASARTKANTSGRVD